MVPWFTLPLEVPADRDVVWVRIDQWFGQPFLAEWDEVNQTFTSDVNSLILPWWRVSRWRYQ